MQMLTVLLAGIVLVAIALLLILRGKKKSTTKKEKSVSVSYIKRTTLLTPAELALKEALQEAIADDFDIYAKVRLADILTVPGNLLREHAIASLSQIRPRSIDFVLCDKQTAQIRCAIRVLDETDEQSGRKQNTAFIDKACAVAGLPLIKFPITSSYAPEEVKQQINNVLVPQIRVDDNVLEDIKIFIEPEQVTTNSKVTVESS